MFTVNDKNTRTTFFSILTINLLQLEDNWKTKGDCLECKTPFHLHIFPSPVKCKQLREAGIKRVRRKPFDKKDLCNKLQAIEPVPFNLLMDWQLRKISTNPFSWL